MKDVIIASNNAHKLSEIRGALDFEGWQFRSLKEAGIVSDPEENGATFVENARLKAQAVHAITGGAAMADDSGLVVDALDGAPGVYSARYASMDGGNASDEANNELLLKNLEGVPQDKRTARFVCALVFVDEDGAETVAEGVVEGLIGYEPQGEAGFGYDPLFWPLVFEGKKTTAQVSQEEKNAISHRGNALRLLKENLLAVQ